MEFKKDLRDFYNKNTDLNEKIYINVIFISSFLTLATSIITLIEGSGILSSLIVFISFIIMAVVGYLSFHLKKVKLGKLVYTYLFCCILLPFIYLTCGGIDSGSPLYMLTSFFLIALLLEGIQGIVCLVVTLIVHIFVLWLPYFEIHSLFDTSILSKSARYFDNTIALIAAGTAIFCLTLMTLNAYRKEHEKNNQLVLELQKTSIMDELSGLYNRRHLYSVLFDLYANIEDNGNYYIAMYDLDNFKKINDTYGHLFGDKVLIDFSNKLRTSVNEEIGELASRYGGEEFMCLYRAKDFESAYSKAETIRTQLENTKWKEAPNLIATVSIGLVACHKFNDMNSCLKGVDDLLYSAKTHGKNKIVYRK